MSFMNVIDKKIEELKASSQDIERVVQNPNYHVKQMEDTIASALEQVNALEVETVEELREEFTGVLTQIPGVVAEPWRKAVNSIQQIQQEIIRWEEMKKLYLDYEEALVAKAAAHEENKAAIESGEVTEPTKMDSIRRKPGNRPPITLGNFRRTETDIESGEDSEG